MKRYSQVVFVCTSNTLLSPVAEGIYRKNSLDWMPRGISRGIVVLFEEPINPKVNVLLMQNGFAISGHSQSRQLEKEDLIPDTLVLTMTLSEKVKVAETFPEVENIFTLGEFVGEDADIADPVGTEEEKYKECFEELFLRVNKVIQKIEEQYWEEETE